MISGIAASEADALNLDPNGVLSLSPLNVSPQLDAAVGMRGEEEEEEEEDDDDDSSSEGNIRELHDFDSISDITDNHLMTSSL